MGIFNTMMGGGGGGVTTFPDMVTIPENYFEGARLYSLSSSSSAGTIKYSLSVTGYITTEYNMSFPNATFVESEAFYGQTKASIYLPKITSISQLSSGAFTHGGIIYLPNFSGSLSVSTYFYGCGGIVAKNGYLDGLYSGAVSRLAIIEAIGPTNGWSYDIGSRFNRLTSVTLYSTTGITNAFFGWPYGGLMTSTLQYLNLPDLTSFGSSKACYNTCLQTVLIPKCTAIPEATFSGCTRLSSINLPLCLTIGQSAFYDCTSLSSISLPKCTVIGSSAFYRCSNLSSISLPKCTSIYYSAFYGCSKLSKLDLRGVSAVPYLGGGYVFLETPLSSSTYLGYFGSIYVPASLYNAFKTANTWSLYSARMVSV